MIYVGASPVIVQAMLGGQAGVGAGGGTPLVTNVLQGGDVVQVATMVPYAIQSLIVRSDIKTTKELTGKKIGVSRLGAIPHFTLQAITKLYNVQGVNVVQTGTTAQGVASLSQGLIDGVITSAPNTFRLMKDGYRELVSPKDFRKLNFEFLINGLVARRSFGAKNREIVIGMIKATMEGTKRMFTDEKYSKAILAKYTRQSENRSPRPKLPLRPRHLRQRPDGDREFDPTHRPTSRRMESDRRQARGVDTDQRVLRQQLHRRDQEVGVLCAVVEVRQQTEEFGVWRIASWVDTGNVSPNRKTLVCVGRQILRDKKMN